LENVRDSVWRESRGSQAVAKPEAFMFCLQFKVCKRLCLFTLMLCSYSSSHALLRWCSREGEQKRGCVMTFNVLINYMVSIRKSIRSLGLVGYAIAVCSCKPMALERHPV
jgi:hypothetical protein